MEILKFDNAATPRRKKSNGNLKSLAGLATVAAIAVLGSTLAANISLGTGSGIEFGQGVQTTAACDDSVVVTPSVRFINASGAGTFYLSTISLSSVDLSSTSTCVGKLFTLSAYNDSAATPVQIATSTVNTSLGITQATFANSTGSTFVGTTGITVTGSGNGTTSGAFTLGFGTPSATSGAVYKITLQSQ
jgi:hypothetical protein